MTKLVIMIIIVIVIAIGDRSVHTCLSSVVIFVLVKDTQRSHVTAKYSLYAKVHSG